MVPRKDDTGKDPKSLAINLATTIFFILPFLAYFDQANGWRYVSICMILFVVAFIVPPVGWMRPHPYSDMPHNMPIGRRF